MGHVPYTLDPLTALLSTIGVVLGGRPPSGGDEHRKGAIQVGASSSQHKLLLVSVLPIYHRGEHTLPSMRRVPAQNWNTSREHPVVVTACICRNIHPSFPPLEEGGTGRLRAATL